MFPFAVFCLDVTCPTDRLVISNPPSHRLLGVLTHQTHVLPETLNFSHEFHYFMGKNPDWLCLLRGSEGERGSLAWGGGASTV